MIDHEVKLNQIRAKNEENIRKQQEKDAKLRAEIERKR